MANEISSSASFVSSIFPRRITPISESDAAGNMLPIARYSSIPDYIRTVYGVNTIVPYKGRFNFLDRSNKERKYDPASTDPYVFKNDSSISQFKAVGQKLLESLTKDWTALDLPVIVDKDRSFSLPDSASVVSDLLANGSRSQYANSFLDNRNDIASITNNVDIMKKASIVRTVTYGWWVVSYAGSQSQGIRHFHDGLEVLTRVFKTLLASPGYKHKYDETFSLQGDPLDTVVGYPLYTGLVDIAGNPISKLEMLEQFSGVGLGINTFSDLRTNVSDRVSDPVLKLFPFAVPPIIRRQPGYKSQHRWTLSSKGLVIDCDTRGDSTNRVAWAASYMHNLALSPIQTSWKTLRKMMPGLFHDGSSWKSTLDYIRSDKPILLESDYSNYDRSIPTDLSAAIMALYAKCVPNSTRVLSMLTSTQDNVPLFWPDYIPNSQGRGWLFTPKKVALLSGLKITSEMGSFVNLVIIAQSRIDAGLDTVDSLSKYLTIAAQSPKGIIPSDYKRNFLIQSDDTLFIGKDLDDLSNWTRKFIIKANTAGIKATLELGDRFLMRQMSNGVDRPLPSRIWQNTLSNEEAAADPLKFVVGLASRTDGCFGVKTIDAFGTGKIVEVSTAEKEFTQSVIDSLYEFCSSSAIPIPLAVSFLKDLKQIGSSMKRTSKGWIASIEDLKSISTLRNAATEALSTRELAAMSDMSKVYSTYLGWLHKNAHSPSNALILAHITANRPDIAGKLQFIEAKEHNFYIYAMKKLGFPLHV